MSTQALASIFAVVSAFATATPYAFAAPTVGPAHPPVTANDPPTVNPCLVAAPDREATLTAGNASAMVSSSGLAYGSSFRDCKRFVAKLHVPADARGPQSGLGGSTPYYKLHADLVNSPNQQTCAQTVLTMDAYLQTAGTTKFVLKTRSKYVGVWEDGFVPRCRLSLVEGTAQQREPNRSGAETWRIVMDAKRGTTVLAVTASVAFDAVPY